LLLEKFPDHAILAKKATPRSTTGFEMWRAKSAVRCRSTRPPKKVLPGQSQELYSFHNHPGFSERASVITASNGADLHCEPNGLGFARFAYFNWLEETKMALRSSLF
jgi:hypothetical protein